MMELVKMPSTIIPVHVLLASQDVIVRPILMIVNCQLYVDQEHVLMGSVTSLVIVLGLALLEIIVMLILMSVTLTSLVLMVTVLMS